MREGDTPSIGEREMRILNCFLTWVSQGGLLGIKATKSPCHLFKLRFQKTDTLEPATKNHLLPLPVAISVCPVNALPSAATFKNVLSSFLGTEAIKQNLFHGPRYLVRSNNLSSMGNHLKNIVAGSWPKWSLRFLLHC